MSKRPFSPEELEQLERLPEVAVDTTDIPEAPDDNWRHARRGELYRQAKPPVALRLDADVPDQFEE